MNKEWKQKWVAALRSGEYVQGYNYLKSQNIKNKKTCFCALGVLCDIWMKERDEDIWQLMDTSRVLKEDKNILNTFWINKQSVLPRDLCTDAGLVGMIGTFYQNPDLSPPNGEDGSVGITELNDDFVMPFRDIADLIEKQL